MINMSNTKDVLYKTFAVSLNKPMSTIKNKHWIELNRKSIYYYLVETNGLFHNALQMMTDDMDIRKTAEICCLILNRKVTC